MTRLSAVALAASLSCAGAAVAQVSNNPYYIGASQTFSRDSNLLRVNDGTTVPTGYSQSDTVSTTALLAGFDQYLGRQHGYANVSLRDYRYSSNERFNNQGYSAVGGLDWSTIERISGSVTGSASRSLQRYTSQEVGFLSDKNLQTAAAVNAKANIGMVTQYSLLLQGSYQRIRNSLDTQAVRSRDFDENTAGFQLQWRPSSATLLGLGASRNDGRYPRFRTAASGDYQADRYRRDSLDVTASLQFSAISAFDARISSGETKYDLNSARNFSGLTGSVNWAYRPAGKLSYSANFTRDTGQDSYATTLSNQAAVADYGRVSNNWRLQSDYAVTGKISATAAVSYYDRKVVQTIDSAAALNASGRDHTTILSLGGRWAPLRNLAVGCDYSNEDRRANGQLVANLKDRIFNCFGQITLQ